MRAGRVALPAAGARGRPGSRRARSRGAGDGSGCAHGAPPPNSCACALAVSRRPWDSAACEGRERGGGDGAGAEGRGGDGRRRGNKGGEGSGCPALRHRGGVPVTLRRVRGGGRRRLRARPAARGRSAGPGVPLGRAGRRVGGGGRSPASLWHLWSAEIEAGWEGSGLCVGRVYS